MRDRRESVQSVSRAVAVLRHFSPEQPSVSLADLCQATGLPKSIVFRLVRTLVNEGLLEEGTTRGHYRIGLGAFKLGSLYTNGNPLLTLSAPYLNDLVARNRHNAYLGALDGVHVVYLASVESDGPLRVHPPLGSRLPAHTAAFGKVLLAELPEPELRARIARAGLRRLTPHTIVEGDALVEHLRQVRTQGYALNDQEAFLGIGAIGAPLYDRAGVAIASISLSYAVSLVKGEDMLVLIAQTLSTARAITEKLHRGGV